MDDKEKIKFGVFGNLGGFGAGVHACIGWRFAVHEIQSFLIELMGNFQFDLPDDYNNIRMRRTYASIMFPQAENASDGTPYDGNGGVSMPLKVSLIEESDEL